MEQALNGQSEAPALARLGSLCRALVTSLCADLYELVHLSAFVYRNILRPEYRAHNTHIQRLEHVYNEMHEFLISRDRFIGFKNTVKK